MTTARELAEVLGVSRAYVYAHAEDLGGIKVYGRWVFNVRVAKHRLAELWRPWRIGGRKPSE